ncbi:MAG TPA: ATP-binding protein [Candidatus Pacearchaeota archaeon]|nr:ATP-binding protein [Candidatus Pacearchaeota archaeon]
MKKFKIPKKPVKEGFNLGNIRMLLIGPYKIGKSSFASKFNNTLFLDAEKGLKRLKVRKWKMRNWKDFCDGVDQITDDPEDIKTVVPDTISTLYKFCLQYCNKKYRMTHPSDHKWGKGWDILRQEFEKPILKLITSNLGVIFISHEKEVEVTEIGNLKYIKYTSNLPNQAREVIMPLVDIIGHCYMHDVGSKNKVKERVYISFKKSKKTDAGDRTGLLPEKMPLNYEKFKKYFKQ